MSATGYNIQVTNFSVLTINILNDLTRWRKRRHLLVDQISELNPDLIALQEVSLKGGSSNAHWLAHELNQIKDENDDVYNLYVCPKTGSGAHIEGLAILSRLPVKRHEILDLLTQNRVAHLVTFRLDGQVLMLVNGKFFWHPGVSPQRQAQVELLLDWLDTQPAEMPVVVAGDFNGAPGTPSIELMRTYFDSAYRAVHGDEPAYTAPTPMPPSNRVKLRQLLAWRLGKRPRPDPSWKGTLDYIFVDPRLHTEDCRRVLDRPDEHDPDIYPSDHYGLYAVIKVN
jgi:endonuclease/exonuclease/phosphatase family metal-dependent hydrolase